MAGQHWNAEHYPREGRFVADLAGEVLQLLEVRPGERMLDLGCGDGVLTVKIAATGAQVVGLDSSPSMVSAARAAGVDARQMKMEALPFAGEFEAVFSNAALHWVRDQDAVLAGVYRALKPGGRFVAEMGGHGNIAALRTGLRAALTAINRGELLTSEGAENTFPLPEHYGARLAAHGFVVDQIGLYGRPTQLAAGGVRGWYETFRSGVLQVLSQPERQAVLDYAERLLQPVLEDEAGRWFADYVRLRFRATRP